MLTANTLLLPLTTTWYLQPRLHLNLALPPLSVSCLSTSLPTKTEDRPPA